MTTAYTPILQLALPVTGELNGTWGTVVNENITSMIEQAIAGLAVINTWTLASHTLTTANGTTDEARCAVLECSGSPGADATVICPTATKLYVIKNSISGGYAVTLKTVSGTGISIPNGSTALLYCNGINVVSGSTYMATISTTQVDIVNQGDLRLQDASGGEYVGLQAPATLSSSYLLTLPVDDGVAGQALITDGSGVLSWSTAASGDVYGPASATDNAVALFDGTTGKAIKNSVMTIATDGATVLSANSTTNALRITQIGTGNALLVEDEANPDATPFVIDASGNVGIGVSAPSASLDISGSSFIRNTRFGASAAYVQRRANGTPSAPTTVVSSDAQIIRFDFYDGASYIPGSQIFAEVDGTPGTNDMPGRLVFSTTPDGAATPIERMRIDNVGRVGIGGAAYAGSNLRINKSITGATSSLGIVQDSAVLSDVTSIASVFYSAPSTQAAAFTLGQLRHFVADQSTIGAGSSITNQYGFYVQSTLTGATNNYGFHSNIASGTGRYNFYAAGTADNYFAGKVGIGVAAGTGVKTRIANDRAANTYTLSMDTYNGVTFENSLLAYFDGTNQYFGNYQNFGLIFTTNNVVRQTISASGTISLGAAVGSESLRVTPVASAVNWVLAQGNVANATFGPNVSASGSDTNIPLTLSSKGTGNVYIQTNGLSNTQLQISNTASSVNYLNVGGGPAGGLPYIAVAGTDANIGIAYTSKGTGAQTFFSNNFASTNFSIAHTASAVNYLNVSGAVTTGQPYLQSAGTDTNIGVSYLTKGTGNHTFYTNGFGSAGFVVAHTTSAVNYFQATGGTTGNAPIISAQGSDANINFTMQAKGTGSFYTYGAGMYYYNLASAPQFAITSTASAINYLQVTGNSAGAEPYMSAQGSDTNINLGFLTKGTGGYDFWTGGNFTRQFAISHTASAVNYLSVYGAATAGNPFILPAGSDANIGMTLYTKGTSPFTFATNSGAEQFRIAHTASAVNYLQVTGGAAGFGPGVSAQGSDTNIPISSTTKGNSAHYFSTNNYAATQFVVGHTASAVNYLQVTGSASTYPTLASQGSGTDVSLVYLAKGSGSHYFQSNSLNTQFLIAPTASAVNYLQVRGQTAGYSPEISAQGSDTNITLLYASKGNGGHYFQTGNGLQFFIASAGSSVNYLQVNGSATTNAPTLSAQGADANITIAYGAKGTGIHYFATGGGAQFSVNDSASAVNYLYVYGGAVNTPAVLAVAGSDTNIDITIAPKGAGNVRFGTYTAGVLTPAGYITIKDAGGTTRRLLVG